MIKALINSSVTKIKLLKTKLKYPTACNILKCKDYCKMYNKIKRKAKSLYFTDSVTAAHNNMEKNMDYFESSI